MEPLPTPFDILEIEAFPGPPPLSFWLAMILIVIISYLAFTKLSKKLKEPKENIDSLDILKKRLSELEHGSNIDETSAEASLLVRSYLTFKFKLPFDSLSSSELKEMAKNQNNSNLKDILTELSEVDFLRYQPSEHFPEAFKKSLLKIESSLNKLNQEEASHD